MPLAHPHLGPASSPDSTPAPKTPLGGRSDHASSPPSGGQRLQAPSADSKHVLRHENQDHSSSSPPESRQDLIDRIKSARDRRWLENIAGSSSEEVWNGARSTAQAPNDNPWHSRVSSVGTIPESPEKEERAMEDKLEAASTIERPRSALHSGDFRNNRYSDQSSLDLPTTPPPPSFRPTGGWLSTSPTTPWFTPNLVPPAYPHGQESNQVPAARRIRSTATTRPRAASYSARSASFTYKPPTSPLANESNNDHLLDQFGARGRQDSPGKSSRRRTFSPRALKSMRPLALSHASSPASGRALPNLRRQGTFPYQAHQPQRSLDMNLDPQPFSVPQTPSARSRAPSQASASSPLQRLPMVGRYEESILRGRMSSLPSRPLDFVAQIGVLGRGACKPSLKCPAHVTVPFPAVFYNYGSRPGNPTSDGPSPYVGLLDLENFLKPVERPGTSQSLRSDSPASDSPGASSIMTQAESRATRSSRRHRRRARDSKHRSSRSPKAPPKGSYRIPQQGQLQIIIKNPNKTAVKLFLVPYDLTGMEAGQKTFIRQRSYSAGPIIDMPLTSRTNLGTDRPEAAISHCEDPKDRPVLRYLIHLNICSPSRGRFYLYKSMRVVFANRVPDGKEKLRQEIQLPDPRYSSYRPDRQQRHPSDGDVGDSSVTRQRSPSAVQQGQPMAVESYPIYQNKVSGEAFYQVTPGSVERMPFTLPAQQLTSSFGPTDPFRDYSDEGYPAFSDNSKNDIVQSAFSPSLSSAKIGQQEHRLDTPGSGSRRPGSGHSFERLSRESYAGSPSPSRPQTPQKEGLLSQRLKDLGEK